MTATYSQLAARATELTEKIDSIRSEANAIRVKAKDANRATDPGEEERIGRLVTGQAKLSAELEAVNAQRSAAILAFADDAHTERADVAPVASAPRKPSHRSQPESRALRWVERSTADGTLNAKAAERLDGVIRDTSDPTAFGARYIAAVGSDDYTSAFMRLITDPLASYTMSPAELAAIRDVRQLQAEERTLLTTQGALAVPGAFDPTINLTSDGAINPLRAISRVVTIGTHTWNGITSAGVTASFDAEEAEVSDDTPTLAGPTITPEKAQAFVEFSIEAGQDWGSLQTELARVLQDARDVLEADKFTDGAGAGSNEPEGVVAGLATTSELNSATTDTFAASDLYRLQEALPPRFQGRARFMANVVQINKAAQFDTANGARLFPEIGNDRLLRKPLHENSDMDSTATYAGGEHIFMYGDFEAGFVIVDRVGMSIELVPHIFHTSNNRPKGTRGLYCYWRTSSAVLVDAAFRILRIKAS